MAMDNADLPTVNRILKREYARHDAPVVELTKARTNDPFLILLTTILSARTKDATTAEVSRRLFKTVKRPADLKKLTQKQLEKLIFPIGFYRTKAKHLRALPDVLSKRFNGKVPETIDELCELPGVGRKTANLVSTVAFDRYGICVDVHVHRISNRLGYVDTKTPLETEMALREKLPRRYWKTWNSHLVSYGQTVCTPTNPWCSKCPIAQHCPKLGVKRSR